MRFLELPSILSLCMIVAGCVSARQQTDASDLPLYNARANMQIFVDGLQYDGMAVTKASAIKEIQILSQADLDLLRITSCHRDFTVEKADKGWFGGTGRRYTYVYVPMEKEQKTMCPLYIQAYARDLVTDWGYIAFRTDEALTAQIDCNGLNWTFTGVSVCQTKEGLAQAIRFDRPVKYVADANCKVIEKSDRSFEVRGQPGFCYAEFSDGKAWHRFILLGYKRVLVRQK